MLKQRKFQKLTLDPPLPIPLSTQLTLLHIPSNRLVLVWDEKNSVGMGKVIGLFITILLQNIQSL